MQCMHRPSRPPLSESLVNKAVEVRGVYDCIHSAPATALCSSSCRLGSDWDSALCISEIALMVKEPYL